MAPPIKVRGNKQVRFEAADPPEFDSVPTLTKDTQLATKKYVDDHGGGGGAGTPVHEEKTTWNGEAVWLMGFTPTTPFLLMLNGVALHQRVMQPPPPLNANEYYYDGATTITLWAGQPPGTVLEIFYIDTSGGGTGFTHEQQNVWLNAEFPLAGKPAVPFIVTLNGVFQHRVVANPGPNEYTYDQGTGIVTFWQIPNGGDVAEAFYL